VDHHRKGKLDNPDAVADLLGSTAKGVMADSVWGIYRGAGNVQIIGRDFEERSLSVSFNHRHGVWQVEGEHRIANLT
jgi:hypothetical protein